MSKRCRSDAVIDPAQRAAFVTANAVALVAERDGMIRRLRKQVTRLLKAKSSLRLEVERLQGIVASHVKGCGCPRKCKTCGCCRGGWTGECPTCCERKELP